jgi:hypothetical protein
VVYTRHRFSLVLARLDGPLRRQQARTHQRLRLRRRQAASMAAEDLGWTQCGSRWLSFRRTTRTLHEGLDYVHRGGFHFLNEFGEACRRTWVVTELSGTSSRGHLIGREGPEMAPLRQADQD